MSELLTPTQIEENSWVIQMTPEIAQFVKVEEGSYLVFHISEGKGSAEILPPASPELKEMMLYIAEKHRDAFAEMKGLGD